jgi:hypothetical protein
MKTKKLSKKLTLAKQTITNLEDRQQAAIHGGSGKTCPACTVVSCGATCCGSVWACSC